MKRLGLIEPVFTGKEKTIPFDASQEYDLPASLDWRNNGGNYVTPIRNQGSCGSCWAFAATAALESYTLIKNNLPDTNLDLSEQILVSCMGIGSCSGGDIEYAARYIRDTGLPLESCYSYTHTNDNCSNSCMDWKTSTDRIGSWEYVFDRGTYPEVGAIKNALNNYGPVVTSMVVYSDFFSYIEGVYSHVSGEYRGNHAVLIIGYNDFDQYFIVKNSWGTGWGEAGYFRIAYSEVGCCVWFGDGAIAYSQEEYGSITGRVTDSDGAVIELVWKNWTET